MLAPKYEKLQINLVRKIEKGGVAIEAGTVRSATVIKEATKQIERRNKAEVQDWEKGLRSLQLGFGM